MIASENTEDAEDTEEDHREAQRRSTEEKRRGAQSLWSSVILL
jgi:hypothetical protein